MTAIDPNNYYVKPLMYSNEKDMWRMFAWSQHFTKVRIGLDHLPLINPAKLNATNESKLNIMQGINNLVTFYNSMTLHNSYNHPEICASMAKGTLTETAKLVRLETMFGNMYTYIQTIPNLTHDQIGGLHDFFRYLLFFPTIQRQCKTRKLLMGHDSSKNKDIMGNLRVAYPTSQFAQKAQQLSSQSVIPERELELSLSQYFLFPMMILSSVMDETDQDVYPELWASPMLIQAFRIPMLSEPFESYIRQGLSNRRYVLPEQGVLVQCSGYGDIESITLKEKRIEWPLDIVLIAKVTFIGGLEDMIAINVDEQIPLSSGYGDFRGFPNDPVLRVVAKAYMDLIAAKRIAHHSPTSRSGSRSGSTSPSATGSFIYLPRTYYDERRVSPIRLRSDATSRLERRPHTVMGHLRKGNPSPAARREAERFGITLPPGYTFVRGYKTGKGKSDSDRSRPQARLRNS